MIREKGNVRQKQQSIGIEGKKRRRRNFIHAAMTFSTLVKLIIISRKANYSRKHAETSESGSWMGEHIVVQRTQ